MADTNILPNDTRQVTINRLKVTINFSEEKNTNAEQSIGQLLLENIFKKGDSND